MTIRIIFLSVGLTGFLVSVAGAAPAIPSVGAPPITAQLSSTYYTNVAGSSEALATARDLKRVDVLYSPSLDLSLMEPLGGGPSLFLTGQAGYNFYQRNSNLDSESINLQGGANANLGFCDTTLSGGWSRQQSNPGDLLTSSTQNVQQLLSTELDANCNKLGDFVPTASVAQNWSSNSTGLYASQDYRSLNATAGLGYKRDSIGTISLIGQFTATRYPHRILALGAAPQDDGYDLYSGGIQYERSIGARLKLSASISDTSLSPTSAGEAAFNGITYNLALGYHVSARLDLNVAVGREVEPASYLNGLPDTGLSVTTIPVINQIYTGQALNATYGVNESFSGQATYRISSRLTASLGVSDTHSNFTGGALVQGANISAQTLTSFFGGLAFNASPTFSISLNAGQDQRHANLVGYSYASGHVGLAVSKAF